MPLINKQELASRLGVSLPTLSAWMRRWDAEFPVEERGTNGRDYKFDAAAVIDFIENKRDVERSKLTERDEALAQLVFPGFEPEPLAPGLSLKDQHEALKIRRLQRQEAEDAGKLVLVSEIRPLLTDAFTSWNARLHAALRAGARDANLTQAQLAAIEARIADAQREFVRETTAYLAPQDAPAPPLH